MTASARTDGATVKAVRDLFDDCFHVCTVEATSAGFLPFTARGLRLGSFDTEAEAAFHAVETGPAQSEWFTKAPGTSRSLIDGAVASTITIIRAIIGYNGSSIYEMMRLESFCLSRCER